MGYVALDGKKLIPAPFIGINRVINRTPDGATKLSAMVTLNINGKAIKGKGGFTYTGSGYPADDFTQEPLEDLIAKIEDLQDLVDGAEWVWLEIQPDPEASAPSIKWRVRPTELNFPDDHWVNFTDYILTLEGQVTESDYAEEIEETWSLQLNDQPDNTYNLTHSISCTSKASYLEAESKIREGWKNAQLYVEQVLGGEGEDTGIIQGITEYGDTFGMMLGAGFIAYDHITTKNINETAGTYSITETWVMSEVPYNEQQNISVNVTRDAFPIGSADVSVSISGEIVGFRQDDDSGYSDALNYFTGTVEPDLYAKAAAKLPSGYNSLHSQPASKQLTYNEITRTVSYNYVYDNGDGDCVKDLTVNVSQSDGSCPDIIVNISGQVQGVKGASTTAWANAQTCWASLAATLDATAATAYANFGGTGSLRGPYNKQYGESQLSARITFNYTWIDRDAATLHVINISEVFDAARDVTTMKVSGNISAICSDTYNDVLAEYTANGTVNDAYNAAVALYSGNDTLNSDPINSDVNYSERNRTISYSYDFSDYGENEYIEEINFSTNESNSNCGYTNCSMVGSIQGKRTTGGSAWTNALTRFNSTYLAADPVLVADYIVGAKRISKSITYSEINNRISFQYEFTDEDENWIIDETVTESWGDDCGYATITKNGTVTGMCTGGKESAYTNAELGFAADVDASIPDGATYLNKKSLGKNRRQGKITYTFEYTNRPDDAMIDETVSTEQSASDRSETVTYSGTITGYCTDVTNNSIKFNNAWDAWVQREAEINTLIGTAYIEMRRSLGKNKRQGTVTYNISYRENNGCIEGSLRESMTVTDENVANIFAIVPILGGPALIQDKGGTTVKRRSVAISASFPLGPTCFTDKPSGVEALVDQNEPSADVVMVERNTESWDPLTGNYSRNKAWVYQDC